MVQRVGLIGCGVISDIYLTNAALFGDIAITACADLRPEAAQAKAEHYAIRALSIEELLGSDVDIVLNLTNPEAHVDVSLAAIAAGKHVYTEKPLATRLADGEAIVLAAKAAGVRVGAAPDTVLGIGVQTARRLIEEGSAGEIVAGVATVMSRGMEHWHPAPAYYFQPGGGPVLDMGPYYVAALVTLLGPVSRVFATGRRGLAERVVTAEGPNRGATIPVAIDTTIHAVLSFVSGAQVTLLASWDVWKHGHTPIELHGVGASLRVPDPNFFGGVVEIARDRDAWHAIDTSGERFGQPNYPAAHPVHANYRGLGLAEMAAAIEAGRPHRLDGDFALHTLDVLMAIGTSSAEERAMAITSTCRQPAPLAVPEALELLAARR